MRGIICYESHEIVRNQGFIDLWLRESARRGIALTLARLEDMSFGLRGNAPYLRIGGQDAHPDFAVMRMKQPLLSRHLERMGVRVFNNAYTSEILNDKRRTHALFSPLAPMMDTVYIAGDSPCPFAYPVVVKAAGGCGGRQVRLCGDEAAYRAAIREFAYQAAPSPCAIRRGAICAYTCWAPPACRPCCGSRTARIFAAISGCITARSRWRFPLRRAAWPALWRRSCARR